MPVTGKQIAIGIACLSVLITIIYFATSGGSSSSGASGGSSSSGASGGSSSSGASGGSSSSGASGATPATSAPAAHTGTGTQSQLFGGGGGGAYDMSCPDGKIMTNISGRGGWWIDQLKGKCDDGTQKGPVGGQGGGPVDTQDCPKGYTGVDVTYGQFMGKLTPKCQGAPISTPIGGGQGSGAGQTKTFDCPSGQVITGITGKAGGYVDSSQFTCK